MKYRFAIAAAALLAAAACRGPGEDDAFRWTNELPAGAVVHLRDGSGDITVRRATGQSVVVNGTRRWRKGRANDIRFVVNQVGNDYYVCAMWSGSGKCGDGGYRGKQTGGFLTMFSLFHRVSDATADLVAEVPANVVLDARTTNGSLQIEGVSAGVTARTANGGVTASNVSGPLALVTTNGDVRLSADSLSQSDSIHLTTNNGSIHAELPSSVEGAFDLSTVNGVVRSDFPVPQSPRGRSGRRLTGQIGASTRVVKMRSLNGTVSVVSRGATH
ncbi:MAG: hypothetical protein JWM41_4953 [Gemmatimonadetes bacterium]|nr:hypothetical protein [Gemmatimonadota bacterium]